MVLLQLPPEPSAPIIVKVIEVPSQTIGDVVMAAVGISGAIAVGAAILGLVLGVGFIAYRMRRQRNQPADSPTDHQQLRLNV